MVIARKLNPEVSLHDDGGITYDPLRIDPEIRIRDNLITVYYGSTVEVFVV
jgi:hypothetical protein